ncbi:hypothetical protein [Bradyrhizobium canariense]|uniref:hypothetical protein n=1 Tax=Bradyrhizobium canariense TaxID=255045 RepID=UPI001178617B|nr:hypothetical protein [Bradyrhizobium canariense]
MKAETAQREREINVFSALMSERGRWGSPDVDCIECSQGDFPKQPRDLDAWFACYSRAGSERGNADQYFDMLAAMGRHLGFPMRREDLENFFVNPIEEKETAVRWGHVHPAFADLPTNTATPITHITDGN